MKIGFIGIGAMGYPMAKNILKEDYELYINDINKDAVKELVDLGAKATETGRELADCTDVIVIMLPNTEVIESVLAGENGLLAGIESSKVIVNMSSIDPMSSKRFASRLKDLDSDWVDSPVSGGTKGAESGDLTLMVGCKDEVLEEVRPVLEVMGDISFVGDVGAGSGVKMINNLLLGINMTAVAEALVLGVKAGIDPEVLFEIINNSSGNSYALEAKVPNYILEGEFDPGFSIDLQYKDLQLAVTTAKELNVPLQLGNLSQQIYENAKAAGLGSNDISSVITLLEELCNVEVRS
jgi:3-hydroxyisobutyrate dehydrogenase